MLKIFPQYILFDVMNMYVDLEIYVFGVHQAKGDLVRRQWIDVKLLSWACKRYTSTSEI